MKEKLPLEIPTELEANFFWAFKDRPGFEIYLCSGDLIRGQVEKVGRYTLRVCDSAGRRTLIYKHDISRILPVDKE